MKIVDVKIKIIKVALKHPFITSLRRVEDIKDILVEVHTDTGNIGYGEAPPTGVITGETLYGIYGALKTHIIPAIIGKKIEELDDLFDILNSCIMHNTSAKAAVDMALWDLYGQLYSAPVYKLLGGSRNKLKTDITISMKNPDEMVKDVQEAINEGYEYLKIKVGDDAEKDLQRLVKIREVIMPNMKIRIDVNQAWTPKQAVKLIKEIEKMEFNIDFFEQPVLASDLEGMRYVTEHVNTDILADESVFDVEDALRCIQSHSANLISIKLMKCGGIYNAQKIVSVAETFGVGCMIGCMLETKLSVNAAAHFAAAKKIITRVDLDGPALCLDEPIIGGALFKGQNIYLNDTKGMGIIGVKNKNILNDIF